MDWLLWSDELKEVMADYWKTVDTILMGRRTYEVSRLMGGGGSAKMATYVFSRSLPQDSDPDVTIIGSDAVRFVRDLKAKDGKDICLMGGGILAKSLFDADLIDEVGFNIHPVILGAGVPALHPMIRSIGLELMTSRTFKDGCVLVNYRFKH
jgi:dihydrofolate reductase